MDKLLDILHKSDKGESIAVARNERQNLRIKTLIWPINPGADPKAPTAKNRLLQEVYYTSNLQFTSWFFVSSQ
jgi:hypothetical protein